MYMEKTVIWQDTYTRYSLQHYLQQQDMEAA